MGCAVAFQGLVLVVLTTDLALHEVLKVVWQLVQDTSSLQSGVNLRSFSRMDPVEEFRLETGTVLLPPSGNKQSNLGVAESWCQILCPCGLGAGAQTGR